MRLPEIFLAESIIRDPRIEEFVAFVEANKDFIQQNLATTAKYRRRSNAEVNHSLSEEFKKLFGQEYVATGVFVGLYYDSGFPNGASTYISVGGGARETARREDQGIGDYAMSIDVIVHGPDTPEVDAVKVYSSLLEEWGAFVNVIRHELTHIADFVKYKNPLTHSPYWEKVLKSKSNVATTPEVSAKRKRLYYGMHTEIQAYANQLASALKHSGFVTSESRDLLGQAAWYLFHHTDGIDTPGHYMRILEYYKDEAPEDVRRRFTKTLWQYLTKEDV